MMLRVTATRMLLRAAQALFTLWLLSAIIFSAMSLVKGDAATQRLAGSGSPEQVAALRTQLGLDKPLTTRYQRWVKGVLRGDWGNSFINGRPVSHVLWERGRFSLALGATASVLLVVMGVTAGVYCGLHPGSVADRLISLLSLGLVTLPEFVTGTLLVMVFAFTLHWLPALSLVVPTQSLWSQWPLFILPVLTLLSVSLAQNIKLIRLGVIRASQSASSECARLNGVEEVRVILHWILPDALGHCLPVLARYIAYLFGGALIAETLFGWPGLAAALLNATLSRDTPVVMGIAMVICTLTVLLNLLADSLTALFNPAAGQGKH
ncbi:ABC transporter permease subunit [Enterobacteriaceae bacterium RIT697]|uniref:ABC transporter permease n=1 Tax=Pantoea endophytica TaxID=92488 RepID=UPI0012AD94DB|nr:ABC transporter permease [Pantoea endophytica]MRT24918.1 ABC transporter permease subunit [Enterobacteriaceae bacterium RIT697]